MWRHGVWLLFFWFCRAGIRADDAQVWGMVSATVLEQSGWRAWLHAEGRASDADPTVPVFFVAPRVRYEFHPLFSLGVGMAVGESGPPASGLDPQGFWRAELEQQSRLPLGEAFQLRLRNRYEHSWFDGDTDAGRTRHRLELYVRAPADWRPLHGLYLQDEFFYNWTAGRWQENRVVPVGLEWRLAEKSRLRTAWQWQVFNRPAGRHVSHALVLLLDVPLR